MSPKKPEPTLPELLGLGHVKTTSLVTLSEEFAALISAAIEDEQLRMLVLYRLRGLVNLADRAISAPETLARRAGKPKGIVRASN